ncbi:MAG TPA: hypothetical protein VGE01_02830, partial [Fimbriimonas sp.]
MRTSEWARLLSESSELQSLLATSDSAGEWRTVAYEARPVLLAAAWMNRPRKILVVTANYERALQWQAKLGLCGVPQEMIAQLPSGTSALFEDAAPEHIALSDRLGALRALAEEAPKIVLSSPQPVLERTLPKEILLDAHLEIEVGREIDPDKLLRQLVNLGYEPQEPVRIPGQFSRRGGIIDIFATGRDTPIRIELFGDEVESIRRFDPNTQRSIGKLESLSLSPSRETLYSAGAESLGELVRNAIEHEAAGLEEEVADRLRELVSGDAQALSDKLYFDRLDLYRPLLHPESGCAIDLLADEDLLVLDEPLELEAIAARNEEELAQALEARELRGEILHSTSSDFLLPPEHMAGHERTLVMTAMNSVPSWVDLRNKVDVNAVSLDPYRGRAEALALT